MNTICIVDNATTDEVKQMLLNKNREVPGLMSAFTTTPLLKGILGETLNGLWC